jgi:hypothetical protein
MCFEEFCSLLNLLKLMSPRSCFAPKGQAQRFDALHVYLALCTALFDVIIEEFKDVRIGRGKRQLASNG